MSLKTEKKFCGLLRAEHYKIRTLRLDDKKDKIQFLCHSRNKELLPLPCLFSLMHRLAEAAPVQLVCSCQKPWQGVNMPQSRILEFFSQKLGSLKKKSWSKPGYSSPGKCTLFKQ